MPETSDALALAHPLVGEGPTDDPRGGRVVGKNLFDQADQPSSFIPVFPVDRFEVLGGGGSSHALLGFDLCRVLEAVILEQVADLTNAEWPPASHRLDERPPEWSWYTRHVRTLGRAHAVCALTFSRARARTRRASHPLGSWECAGPGRRDGTEK